MRRGAAFILLGGWLAYGDCESGTRDATPAEAAFARRVHAALISALPASPPAGFQMTPVLTGDPVPRTLCRDTRPGDFKIAVRVVFPRATRVADGDTPEGREAAKIVDEVAALRALPPDKKAEWEKLNAPYQEMAREARKLERAGDKEAAKTSRAAADKLYEASAKYLRDYERSIEPQVRALFEKRSKLNQEVREKYQDEVVVQLVANDRFSSEQSSAMQEVVVLGAAKVTAPAIRVQQLRIVVSGPARFRKTFLDAIDRGKLQALVGS